MSTRAIQIEFLLSGLIDPTTGLPLSGATAYFYAAGTTTPKNVWTEKEKTNAFTSYELETGGIKQLYGDGIYKIVIKDSTDATIYTWDNIKIRAHNFSVVTKIADYDVTSDDDVILVNTSSGDVNINMLAAGSMEYPVTIIHISGSNNIIINPDGSETIDGDSSYTFSLVNSSFVVISDGSNLHKAGIPPSLITFSVNLIYASYNRALFTYNGASTAFTFKVGAAGYHCKDKVCTWNSELTTTVYSGTKTSNDHVFLYIDYSAVTSGISLTNAELIWSTTAPSWNGTYKGWYNGDDRCIFSGIVNSSEDNFLPFSHDGGRYVRLSAPRLLESSQAGYTTTYADAPTIPIPDICTQCSLKFSGNYSDADSGWLVRTNGHSGSAGYVVISVTSTLTYEEREFLSVFTDSSRLVEIKESVDSTNTLSTYLTGWYLPAGM